MAEQNSPLKVGVIASAVIIAGATAWVANTSSTGEDVTAIKPQIARLKDDVKRLEDWQSNWERNGELPADVRQTKDIEFLKERIATIKVKVKDLEKKVHSLEIYQAASGKIKR